MVYSTTQFDPLLIKSKLIFWIGSVAVVLPFIVCALVVATVIVLMPVFVTEYLFVFATAVGSVRVVVPETKYT
jgi:hypothetical protein